ncbi:MAG: TonB-dependent receptor [Acidobacteria bacterium]|nr:TonB-dependent receptor [Acidobacteriota bacterium]MCI0722588.1 TonB-dependent receptor [Acidobacteriota bacterium]
MKHANRICVLFISLLGSLPPLLAQPAKHRIVSGEIVTVRNERVQGVRVSMRSDAGEQMVESDADGWFRLSVADEPLSLQISGKYIVSQERALASSTSAENLRIEVEFFIPPIHESLVITAAGLDPNIERRNSAIYRNTLFSRDDQVFHTLDAGINAGQHEGGGKSLEIRRFGFNLDHGGVSGGLKVLVDNVQQNQATQGHGQGYLGQLKSLTPELVQEVSILNGPFSPEYGDFSGLGVVHIRQRETLDDTIMARVQAGSFDSYRAFAGFSPKIGKADSFLAYEASRTNGPFLSPLRYKRDNLTGSITLHMTEGKDLGFKFNVGRNDYYSSGQIPLDEVAEGHLDRFGFLDPDLGGRVRSGTLGAYFRKENPEGKVFKLDGFLSRSLFDLYSNFTYFLNDEFQGDEIQQHDSRLQEGANTQYLHPHKFFGQRALFLAGANFHDNQILVGLIPTVGRNPTGVYTRANAQVTNTAGYVQQALDFWQGRLHLDGGLRYDLFRFRVDDRLEAGLGGSQAAGRLQPKANAAFTPLARLPVTFHFNYGRGISSQDARGVTRNPSGVKVSTTDFYQAGISHNWRRFSLSTDWFLIDRSNEQVYIPDDGSFEFKGPSRAHGFEVKSSIQLTRHLAFNGGVTKVSNAFYRATLPRLYVDSAPHLAANAALTLAGWRGFIGSLRLRSISSYRLDGEDPGLRASGLTVLDLNMAKPLRPWVDLNFSVDNLTNKTYYETQNYFESRLRAGDPVVSRIHATPGYPVGMTVGLTFHLGKK